MIDQNLLDFINIYSKGGTVDDAELDQLAVESQDLIFKLMAKSLSLNDADGSRLRQAVGDILQEMSKLLENTENAANKFSLPNLQQNMNLRDG